MSTGATDGTRERGSPHLERFENACREIKRQYPRDWRDDLAAIEAEGVPELIAIAKEVDAEPKEHGRSAIQFGGAEARDSTTHAADTAAFLRHERKSILASACRSLARAPTRHYDAVGTEAVQERLTMLFDELVECVDRRDLGPMIAYAERIAEERYIAGYELPEVQVALNSLEEATWSYALARLEATQLADALTLVSTVLGTAKDVFARRYVLLATKARAPALDVDALFAGSA